GGSRRGQQRFECTERIEHREVRGRIEQRLMLVLTVQLDETRRQVLQRTGRGEGAVDEGAAPALRGDLAAHQELFPAVLEDRFDGGNALASAIQSPGGPPTG